MWFFFLIFNFEKFLNVNKREAWQRRWIPETGGTDNKGVLKWGKSVKGDIKIASRSNDGVVNRGPELKKIVEIGRAVVID